MKAKVIYLFLVLFPFLSWGQGVLISNSSGTPDPSAVLEISSNSQGLLIPRMTEAERLAISSPANGLMVFQTDKDAGFYIYYENPVDPTKSGWSKITMGLDGFYINFPSTTNSDIILGEDGYGIRSNKGQLEYKNEGDASWTAFPAPPPWGALTIWWYKPLDSTYIRPDNNSNIRIYDDGERYGFYFDGGTNQYGVFVRSTSNTFLPTGAILGWTDVPGQQTYGYLGYRGHIKFGVSSPQEVWGAAVWGEVPDTNSVAGFFRTYDEANYAALVSYSNTWIPAFFYAEDSSDVIASRPTIYGYMDVKIQKTGHSAAVKGIANYSGTNGGYDILTGVIGASFPDEFFYGFGGFFEQYSTANDGSYLLPGAAGVYGTSFLSGYTTYERYQFGTFGSKDHLYLNGTLYLDLRSGGAFGISDYYNANNDAYGILSWGSLGYIASNQSSFGVYANGGTGSGTGKNISEKFGIGIGAIGDLFGGLIYGQTYGLNVKGKNYALFVDGSQINNTDIVVINKTSDGNKIPSYVLTSTSTDIIAKGIGSLVNGKAVVKFGKDFTSIIDTKAPIIVTVTPLGQTNGVYVSSISSEGFTVVENNGGKSNVKFNWIAIAQKNTSVNIPKEVLSKDYEQNMARVYESEISDDANKLFVYYDEKGLHFKEVQFTDDKTKVNIPKDIKPKLESSQIKMPTLRAQKLK